MDMYIFLIFSVNKNRDFEVYETLNMDLGHPHYDVKINSEPKETLHCMYGQNNGFSCLLMYLWALSKRKPDFIRKNGKLSQLIYQVLGVVII